MNGCNSSFACLKPVNTSCLDAFGLAPNLGGAPACLANDSGAEVPDAAAARVIERNVLDGGTFAVGACLFAEVDGAGG